MSEIRLSMLSFCDVQISAAGCVCLVAQRYAVPGGGGIVFVAGGGDFLWGVFAAGRGDGDLEPDGGAADLSGEFFPAIVAV